MCHLRRGVEAVSVLKIIDNLKILSSQGSLLSCEECAINSAAFFQNMVGPDEVDDELEPEIREEMTKYGQVASVMIHKVDSTLRNIS